MENNFKTQAYLAQFGNYIPVSDFKKEAEVETPSNSKNKKEIRVFTNWSDVNKALENYELHPDDEMHEQFGVMYRFTKIRHTLEEDGNVSAKYEYEVIK